MDEILSGIKDRLKIEVRASSTGRVKQSHTYDLLMRMRMTNTEQRGD